MPCVHACAQSDHFAAMSPRSWGDEFETNYTKVVRELKEITDGWGRTRLFLTLPFPLAQRSLDQGIRESGLFERVRRVSSRLGVPLIDLNSTFAVMARATAVPRREGAPKDRAPNHSALSESMYRDSVHPSRLGSQVAWGEILQAVAR